MADKRSFEEQVRDELTGFTLTPDAEVWDNVGKALQDDKKRRWVIWFFLFAICSSIVSYWLYGTNADTHTASAPNIKSVIKPAQKPASQPIKPANADTPADKPFPGEALVAVQKKNAPATFSNTGQKRSAVFYTKQNINGRTDRRNMDDHTSSVTSIGPENGKQDVTSNKQYDSGLNITTSTARRADKSLTGNDPDTSFVSKPEIETVTPDADNTMPPASPGSLENEIAKTKKKIPWKLGIAIDIGRSELVSFSTGAYASSNNAAVFPPGNNSNAFQLANGAYYTAAPRAGYSFGIGAEAVKAVSKDWTLAASLGYQLYTTRINVGNKVDSLLTSGSYYVAGNDRTYVNDYHFLQAGLAFYRKFSIGSSFSFRWNIGFGINWLFLNDALQFNTSQRTLYVDNSKTNKVQANLTTGLDFGIGKRPLVYVGPDMGFFISKYDPANTSYNNRRFFRFGIKTHVAFGKR